MVNKSEPVKKPLPCSIHQEENKMSCVKGSVAWPEEMFWKKSDFSITLIFANITVISITLLEKCIH